MSQYAASGQNPMSPSGSKLNPRKCDSFYVFTASCLGAVLAGQRVVDAAACGITRAREAANGAWLLAPGPEIAVPHTTPDLDLDLEIELDLDIGLSGARSRACRAR